MFQTIFPKYAFQNVVSLIRKLRTEGNWPEKQFGSDFTVLGDEVGELVDCEWRVVHCRRVLGTKGMIEELKEQGVTRLEP